MKKIFVTGGTGFIGTAVVNALMKQQQYEIYVLTRQKKNDKGRLHYIQGAISDEMGLKTAIKNIKPEILVHLAWNVKEADYMASFENCQWVEWSKVLAKVFLENGGKVIIGSGTCLEYELSACSKLKENMPAIPKTLYGESKLAAYTELKSLCIQYKARFVWGRIFYPYGPGEEDRKLITSVRKSLLANKKFICRTPNNRVDYIHIDDVAEIFTVFVGHIEAAGIINICTGQGHTIRDILMTVARQVDKTGYLECQPNEGQVCIVGEIQKLNALKFKHKYSLLDGLKTYEGVCF